MILDFDLDFLRAALALVDANLARLDEDARSSQDPDSFGILDAVEYIIGLGFVACQTYATAVVSRSGLKGKRREALAFGPMHPTGRSVAQVMNAAANYWKHSAEWSLGAPTRPSEQTVDVISSLGVDPDAPYPMASVLYEILAPQPGRFANLMPLLTEWRDALPK